MPGIAYMRQGLVGIVILAVLGFSAWWGWRFYATQSSQATYETAAAEHDWPVAVAAAGKWAQMEPESVEAWLAVAEANRRVGQFDQTAAALAELPDDDPRTLTSLALRGDLLLSELRKPKEAIENWQRMLKIAPTANLAHQRLIYVYAMLLMRSQLQQQIYSAIEQRCEPPEAYIYLCALPSLQFSDGLIKCSEWLRASPGDADLEIAQAVYAARSTPSRTQAMFGLKGVVPGDMSLIHACRETYPASAEVLAVFIDLAIYEGDVEQVAELLEAAGEVGEVEHDSRFLRYHGWVALNQRQPEAAVEWGHRALLANPLDWKARHLLADAERLAGDAESAKRDSELAARGKILERRCLELPTGSAATPELLDEIRVYARDSGDQRVEQGLAARLKLMR